MELRKRPQKPISHGLHLTDQALKLIDANDLSGFLQLMQNRDYNIRDTDQDEALFNFGRYRSMH